VFRNKQNEDGIIVRNKARLVAQGYIEVEGLDFERNICLIARLVYVEKPPWFEDCKKPNHLYKFKKALYGLKQAPREWYERLKDFLLSTRFKMGKVDTTLFTKTIGNDLFVCQIYVDDIIFILINQVFSEEFGRC
jgi:hypothetical protein